MVKTLTGSIFKISFSSDGTAFACAGGNGSVIVGYVMDRRIDWKHFEFQLVETRKVLVHDLEKATNDVLGEWFTQTVT